MSEPVRDFMKWWPQSPWFDEGINEEIPRSAWNAAIAAENDRLQDEIRKLNNQIIVLSNTIQAIRNSIAKADVPPGPMDFVRTGRRGVS